MDMINAFAGLIDANIDMKYGMISYAFHAASSVCVPQRTVEPRRSWISQGTLALIEERLAARRDRPYDKE